MLHDEEELLRFAFLWVRFSVFGEHTVKLRAGVAEDFREKLEEKKKKESTAKTPEERTG
jgi:hypothetical protein